MAQYTFDAQLKTQIAKNFVSDFQPFGKNKVFLGIGQINDVPTQNPPLEHRSGERDVITRRNISYAKRISPSDVTLMIPRVDWTSGITMSPLDTADDMSEVHDVRWVHYINRLALILAQSPCRMATNGNLCIPFRVVI